MSTKTLESAKVGDTVEITFEARVIALGLEGADEKSTNCTKVLTCAVIDPHPANHVVTTTIRNPNYKAPPAPAPVESIPV